mgnify:CR=1 FL=1
MIREWLPLAVFAVCYALFALRPRWRSATAVAGALAVGLSGSVGWRELLFELINWNVIGLFFGTLILAELFMQSRAPAVLAEKLVARTGTFLGAALALCGIASAFSAIMENVAVVLLIAPVAFSLCERLKLSPLRLLIALAVCSNLQGTATLIGDPPSMILGGYMKMSFNDFFVYRGKPSIFFAVEAGALASLPVLTCLFWRHREPIGLEPVERIRSPMPSVLLALLVLCLSFASTVDPQFAWAAGTSTLILAGGGLLWHRAVARWGSTRQLLRTLDWDTTFFLMGIFVIVGAVGATGWLDRLAAALAAAIGGSPFEAFAVLTLFAVAVSAFVDNVPFVLAMIPVAGKIAQSLGVSEPLLLFGLLIGSCLGGNITPIGASANIVAIGLLRKRGQEVSFRAFMSVGLPFTAAAVLAGGAVIWWVWGP